jgi:hypothetical protein
MAGRPSEGDAEVIIEVAATHLHALIADDTEGDQPGEPAAKSLSFNPDDDSAHTDCEKSLPTSASQFIAVR